MRILVDIGHPAHVHYSKNAILEWQQRGHKVIITTRNKDVIVKLLNSLKFSFISRGKGKNSKLGKLIYMLRADLQLLYVSLKHKPDIYLSFSSPYAAQVAYLLKRPHIALNDTEHTDKMHLKFTYPFSSTILTPMSYQNDLGDKQIRFKNIDDGLYLHTNYFQPDRSVKKELLVNDDEDYVILRFVSWNAHHDYGQSGLDLKTKRELIALLKTKYKVFISSEEKLEDEFSQYKINIPPEKMHDVLAYATLFIGESGTMSSESAFLGTSAVYINSLPLMCYLKLEQDAGLLKHFNSSVGVLEHVKKLISDKNLKNNAKERSLKMKKDFIDVNKFLVWFIEAYPKSKKLMKENSNYQDRFK